MKPLPFMTSAELRALDGPTWLIDGIIPDKGKVMLFGEEGSHKTFIAIDMALCVATGTDYHGRAVERGHVVYVAAEGGAPIAKRLEAWEQHHGTEATDGRWLLEPVLLDNAKEAQNFIENLRKLDAPPKLAV